MAVNVDFLQGFAACMTTLVYQYDQPTMAKECATNNGFNLNDFEIGAQLDDFDLKAVRKAFGACLDCGQTTGHAEDCGLSFGDEFAQRADEAEVK